MKIKKILVPTDFSEPARNAANYAVALAKDMKADIILYHAYHIPVPTAEMPVMVISPEQLEKDSMERLTDYKNELKRSGGEGVVMDCLVTPGFAAEEIVELAEQKSFDLIVMGVRGSGSIAQALLGSVTTGVLKECHVPLLMIPTHASYKKPSKVGFAYDYASEVSKKVLDELKAFINPLHPELFIIDVEAPEEKVSMQKAVSGLKLESALEGINHSLHFPVNKDVLEGLLEFDKKHKVDLLVMIPKRHSLLDRIFHKSNTRRMAYHTETPVLALHE